MERKPKPGWKVWHPPPSESSRRAPRWRWTGIEGKTLWEWLELMAPLILSAAIAYLTVTVTQFQFQVQQHAEDQRTKDSALQSYLDQISDQLIDEHNTQLRKLDPDPEVLEL